MAGYTPKLTQRERRRRNEEIVLFHKDHPEVTIKFIAEKFQVTTAHIYKVLGGGIYSRSSYLPPEGFAPPGMSRHPLYATYTQMLYRCYNPQSSLYTKYGNLGITVCDRWKEPNGQGFLNFLSDVKQKPPGKTEGGKDIYSLDRYPNPYGNYEPGNVRWATRSQQSSNNRILGGRKRISAGCSRKLYLIYNNMRYACYDSKIERYKHVGAKGIRVCDKWLGDQGLKNFFTDMGEPPLLTHLERIDKTKDYSKDNCFWEY